MKNLFYTIAFIFLLSVLLTRAREINTVIKFISDRVGDVVDIFYLK
jgi:hypothetical protein